MAYIIAIIIVIVIACSPFIRTIVKNPFKSVYNSIIDIYKYFHTKVYNNAPYGQIISYCAMDSSSFGCGKTLTVVNKVHSLYKRFDNCKVYSAELGCFVTQKVCVLSNVSLSFPYIKLKSLQDFVDILEYNYQNDLKNKTSTITYMIIDEAGSQLNSRQFKSNFDPTFIKVLLTSRHYKASVFLTSQRFSMIDALMRQVTNTVYCCKKIWRVELVNAYDGYELEISQNPALVKPLKRSGWFIRNKSFKLYDTFELVQNLQKSCEQGDMISEQEILALQNNNSLDSDFIVGKKRKFKKSAKR